MQKAKYNSDAEAYTAKNILNEMLLKDLFKYKALNKKMHPKRNYRYDDNSKYEGYTRLADVIHNTRLYLKELQHHDKLVLKTAERENCSLKYLHFYENPEGDKGYLGDDYYSEYKSIDVKVYPLAVQGDLVWANTTEYWKDELINYIKTDGKTKLHSKLYYIRVGDEFFKRNDFFSFKGQVYDRKKWAVQDGALIDLTKSIKIDVDTDAAYCLQQKAPFAKNYFLKADEGEEFENVSGQKEPAFATIKIYQGGFLHRLFGGQFLNTLFASNKKRLYNNDCYYIYVTKEQMMNLKCEPSNGHKELFAKIETDYAKAYLEYSVSELDKTRFRGSIMRNLGFMVEIQTGSANGIKERIYKELFGISGNAKVLYIDELNARLKILQEILKKEKEYAKND